jgi:ABC-2 type transport system permease protein
MSQSASPASTSRELLSIEAEGRAFWRMRRRVAATLLRQALAQSRFRVALVVVLSAILWGGMYWLFLDGFTFLHDSITHPDTHARTIGAVFGSFFGALLLMLVFSSAVLLYGSLFCSTEIPFLFSIPARAERIFLHKFQEAIVLSSWGFVLLASPILVAYGIVERAPWYYYAILPFYLLAFLYIPAALGAVACLSIVRRVPKSRLWILLGSLGAVIAAGAWVAWSLLSRTEQDLLTPYWFQELLGRMQFSEQRLLPSWWLSSGLLNAATDDWAESLLFLGVLIANALFFRQLAVWTAGRIYRPAYSGLVGRRSRRKRSTPALSDRLLSVVLHVLPTSMRLMLVKDVRLFRRDPAQWTQFLIFLALLVLYFANIRKFSYDNYLVGWVNMVSFLNLAVVGLLLSTFTTRFIFPMVSLEGRRFWVLGLLPLRRDAILWSKFLFAAGGSIIPCSALVFLSDKMLNVSTLVAGSHQLTCLVLCFGLSVLAVGLGARLPNLRETSPARIAAGFGGTLNLVLSTAYIAVIVGLTAVPIHFYLAAKAADHAMHSPMSPSVHGWLVVWLTAGAGGSVVLGALATLLPMWIGARSFRRLEF